MTPSKPAKRHLQVAYGKARCGAARSDVLLSLDPVFVSCGRCHALMEKDEEALK